jgi:outer membrane protein
MKKIIPVFIITIAFAHNASATQLQEALALAYQSNPQIKSAIQELQAVDEEMPAAIAGVMPSVSANLDRGKRTTDFSPFQKIDGVTDSKTLEVTQPLFSGGRTYASIKKADNEIMAARHRLKNAEQQVLLSAIEAYMGIVLNEEFYRLAQNKKSVMEQHLEAANSRFEMGEVTQTDVAQAKASLAKADSELISASRTLESAHAEYKKVIGQPPTDVKMPDSAPEVSTNLDEIVNKALENNPVIQSAKYTSDSANNAIAIEKSSLLPHVNAYANRQKLDGSTFSTTDSDSKTIGVRVSIPLYQSGAEYAQVRRAQKIAGKSAYDLTTAQNDIRDATVKAYENFMAAKELTQSNILVVDAFNIALDDTQQESLSGNRTTLDVLDAEQALFEAKASLIRAQHDEIVTSYTLLAYSGSLTAKDLALPVEIYKPEENYNRVKFKLVGF